MGHLIRKRYLPYERDLSICVYTWKAAGGTRAVYHPVGYYYCENIQCSRYQGPSTGAKHPFDAMTATLSRCDLLVVLHCLGLLPIAFPRYCTFGNQRTTHIAHFVPLCLIELDIWQCDILTYKCWIFHDINAAMYNTGWMWKEFVLVTLCNEGWLSSLLGLYSKVVGRIYRNLEIRTANYLGFAHHQLSHSYL